MRDLLGWIETRSGGRLACGRGRHLAARNEARLFYGCGTIPNDTDWREAFSAGRDAPDLWQAWTPAAARRPGVIEEKSPAQHLGDGLGPGADVQLFVDAADVGAHRLEADAEFIGDFLVHEPLAEKIEHFLFAWR